MKKEDQIKFLQSHLEGVTKEYLVNEARYRATKSRMLSTRNVGVELSNADKRMKITKEMMESEIRHIKIIIKEIKEGELNV